MDLVLMLISLLRECSCKGLVLLTGIPPSNVLFSNNCIANTKFWLGLGFFSRLNCFNFLLMGC